MTRSQFWADMFTWSMEKFHNNGFSNKDKALYAGEYADRMLAEFDNRFSGASQ